MPDILFDTICRRLLAEWDSIEHAHKHLLSREALESGSGFHLSGKYPSIVIDASNRLRRKYRV